MVAPKEICWIVTVACLLPLGSSTFVTPGLTIGRSSSFSSSLYLAKKSKGKAGKKGFAKVPDTPIVPTKQSQPTTSETSAPLQSIDMPRSDSIPTMSSKQSEVDTSLAPEERTKQILRETYGLKSLEEQQTDIKKQEKMAEERKKREQWKKMAAQEDVDIMTLLPAPLLIGIDRFLKIGLGITTVAFIAAGIGITAEAWSASSGQPLPEDIDQFIVNVVEPNFTPGLVVLLAFSISLGIFASLQLGSESSQYKENK